MRELSLHILDLAQNSIAAGASLVTIEINENDEGFFVFSIKDNGCGMDEKMLRSVRDPFVTTRKTRKVGMGIPFLDMVTAQCGGTFSLESQVGLGTVLKASFKEDNIDRPPLGDIVASMLVMIVANPQLDIVFIYKIGERGFTFDTREMRQMLGEEADFSLPEVYTWIESYLRQQLDVLHAGQEEEE